MAVIAGVQMPRLSENADVTITIEDNFFLRTLKKEEVGPNYVSWLNDPEVTQFTEQRHRLHSLESVIKFVDEKYKSDVDFLFGIYFKKIHVGNIKLGPIDWKNGEGEVSYIIGEKRFWGMGLATKSIYAVKRYARDSLKLACLTAGYYEENFGSAKALKKSGFKIYSRSCRPSGEGCVVKEVVLTKCELI